MNRKEDLREDCLNPVAQLFSWWSNEYGGDERLADIFEVPRQTIWRWRTGVISKLRPSDRREVARRLRVEYESLQEFLEEKILLAELLRRRGERNLPLEEILIAIEGRPPHELVAVNLRVATLLVDASQTQKSDGSKKKLRPVVPDTLKRIKSISDETVIELRSFREARRLKNLILAAQHSMGLTRKQYLQLVAGGSHSIEAATLLYADVMDETLRSHAEATYKLFCPHLFRLVEWRGEGKEEPVVDYHRTYTDLHTLLSDLKNSDQNVAVR